jgi:rare lipoprotein A
MESMKKLLLLVITIITVFQTVCQAETATYYSNYFHGRKTSSGKYFNQNHLVGASNSYSIGSIVEVKRGKKKVRVKIIDNGDFGYGHIDLSKTAFLQLGKLSEGIIEVSIRKIK